MKYFPSLPAAFFSLSAGPGCCSLWWRERWWWWRRWSWWWRWEVLHAGQNCRDCSSYSLQSQPRQPWHFHPLTVRAGYFSKKSWTSPPTFSLSYPLYWNISSNSPKICEMTPLHNKSEYTPMLHHSQLGDREGPRTVPPLFRETGTILNVSRYSFTVLWSGYCFIHKKHATCM